MLNVIMIGFRPSVKVRSMVSPVGCGRMAVAMFAWDTGGKLICFIQIVPTKVTLEINI